MESKLKSFAVARAASGISADEFAKSLGVSRQHVFAVLKYPERSARVSQAIDQFIKKNLTRFRLNRSNGGRV